MVLTIYLVHFVAQNVMVLTIYLAHFIAHYTWRSVLSRPVTPLLMTHPPPPYDLSASSL